MDGIIMYKATIVTVLFSEIFFRNRHSLAPHNPTAAYKVIQWQPHRVHIHHLHLPNLVRQQESLARQERHDSDGVLGDGGFPSYNGHQARRLNVQNKHIC